MSELFDHAKGSFVLAAALFAAHAWLSYLLGARRSLVMLACGLAFPWFMCVVWAASILLQPPSPDNQWALSAMWLMVGFAGSAFWLMFGGPGYLSGLGLRRLLRR